MENEVRQNESGRRSFLLGLVAACWAAPARAEGDLDAGGLTFRDFAVEDRGASFSKGDSAVTGTNPDQHPARLLEVNTANGFARVRFDSIKVEVAVPLGWQTSEDWERGVAYSTDQSYRLIVWKVDFAFEGVKDAEHYAATKAGAIHARRPSIQAQARKLDDGSFLMVYENVPSGQGDREKRTVFDFLEANPGDAKQGVLITLGVPASEGNRGLKLLALLKQKLKPEW